MTKNLIIRQPGSIEIVRKSKTLTEKHLRAIYGGCNERKTKKPE
jgi:hypothetical protein